MDPMQWDESWDEDNPDHSLQTTSCRCTLEQKERSRSIFPKTRPTPPSALELSMDEATPATSYSLFRPDGTPKPKLDKLPREILFPILQLVFDEETRSRDLCHCSRPKTSYETARKLTLEHRIVNTITLRGTCRAFREWTLEEFDRRRIHEVDVSDFDGLKRKFKTTGAGIARRLVEDFPCLVRTGIEIYLGNPGNTSNLRSVIEMLQGERDHVFSGMTFWDLDYYYGNPIPELLHLIGGASVNGSETPLRILLPMFDIHHAVHGSRVPSLLSPLHTPLNHQALIKLYKTAYDEHQMLFLQLLGHLHFRTSSKVHLPLSSMVFSSRHIPTIDTLVRGCECIIFRSFYFYPHWPKQQIRDIVLARAANPDLQKYGDEQFIRWFNIPSRQDDLCHQSWIMDGLMQTNLQRWFLFERGPPKIDATHIEIHPCGKSWAQGREASRHENGHVWPHMNTPQFTMLASMCQNLKSVVIVNVNRSDVQLGSILKLLLPSAGTLTRFVYNSHKHLGRRPGNYHDGWGETEHACALLQQFPKLEYLEATTKLCPDAFLPSHPFLPPTKCQPLRKRQWIFRLPKEKKTPATCYPRNVSLGSASTTTIQSTQQRMNELGFDSKYTPEAMQVLGQYCRDWRDRNEEMSKESLDWSVKIYSNEGMRSQLPRGQWSLPPGLVFMPLARPPRVLVNKAVNTARDEWNAKDPLLQKWLSAT